MEDKPKLNRIIQVTGRLSYPRLWKPARVNKDDLNEKEKFGATIIMDKKLDAASIEKVRQAIKEVKMAKWKTESPTNFRGDCLRDGSEKAGKAGYGDKVMFTASSRETEEGKPMVLDRNKTPLVAEDHKPYAGANCDFSIELWPQDNKHGRRVNAKLRIVRFLSDNEPFGSESPIDTESELPDVDDVEAGEVTV